MNDRPETHTEPDTEPAELGQPAEPPAGDELVDEVAAESFPASDPPQWWAGPSR